jgi:hypothetical protein
VMSLTEKIPNCITAASLALPMYAFAYNIRQREVFPGQAGRRPVRGQRTAPAGLAALFTSVTAFRFARELVAFSPVSSGSCDEITDKANGRGWCDCRPRSRFRRGQVT